MDYGYHRSPFGTCLIALFGEKVAFLGFGEDRDLLFLEMGKNLSNRPFQEDLEKTTPYINRIFEGRGGEMHLEGTSFQISVWQALLSIPYGKRVSYEEIALKIGCIKAVRATASAIGKNPISYLIPCHRVIYKTGAVGRYRWGSEIKQQMLDRESKAHFQ